MYPTLRLTEHAYHIWILWQLSEICGTTGTGKNASLFYGYKSILHFPIRDMHFNYKGMQTIPIFITFKLPKDIFDTYMNERVVVEGVFPGISVVSVLNVDSCIWYWLISVRAHVTPTVQIANWLYKPTW